MKRFIILSVVFLFAGFEVLAYSDVNDNTVYKEAIEYATENGLVKGYEDNSFKPEKRINRAEFVKILVEAKLNSNPQEMAADCFYDVPKDAWYASYVCYAKEQGIIKGYDDGNFRPGSDVNLVEAAKIFVNVFGLPKEEFSDKEWFYPFVKSLSDSNFLPQSFGFLGQAVKRGEMVEILWRIKENKTGLASVKIEDLKSGSCRDLTYDIPQNVDIEKVKSAWLGWNNAARAEAGLHAYTYNDQLAYTAILWSNKAKGRGYIDHKRNGQTAYYDYDMIKDWFQYWGLTFQNVNRVTFTENIGWGTYSCTQGDCTQKMIDAIRHTFDFFMAEKGKSYRPHYNSLMNQYFKEIGMGIAVDTTKKKIYLTIHYGTSIISNPEPFCGQIK